MDQIFNNGSQQYIEKYLQSGCIQLTVNEAKKMINELGFYIDKNMSMYYTNTNNEIKYFAYSINLYDKAKKVSFANVSFGVTEEEKQRRDQLQFFRRTYFATEIKKGNLIIWDF